MDIFQALLNDHSNDDSLNHLVSSHLISSSSSVYAGQGLAGYCSEEFNPSSCLLVSSSADSSSSSSGVSTSNYNRFEFPDQMLEWHCLHYCDNLPGLLHIPDEPISTADEFSLTAGYTGSELYTNKLKPAFVETAPRKRQRNCFTLESVSRSLQSQNAVVPVSAVSKNVSEAVTRLNSGIPVVNHGVSGRYKENAEPQSVAARERRKKISERVRELEKLIPGGNKLDTASMLDEAIRFVKFLQIQVQLLEAVGGNSTNNEANQEVNHSLNVRNNSGNGSNHALRSFPFGSTVDPTVVLRKSTGSSPLVLSETLQHALFKHRRCVATIEQCPFENLLLL